MGILGSVLGALTGSTTTTTEKGSTTGKTDSKSKTLQDKITEATKESTSSIVSSGSQTTQQETANLRDQSTTSEQIASGGTTQLTSQFGSDALKLLESLFKESGANVTGSQARSQSLADLATRNATSGFDPVAFVADTLQAAESRFNRETAESLNVLGNQLGGTERGNSAAALIKGRLEEENRASLAGIRAQATGTAQDIVRQNISQAAGLEGFNLENLVQIGELLRGAETTGQVDTTSQQATKGTAAESATGTQTGAQQTRQEQETQALDTLLEIVNAITSQTASSTSEGTSDKTTKEKESGSLLDLFSGDGLSNLTGGIGNIVGLFT